MAGIATQPPNTLPTCADIAMLHRSFRGALGTQHYKTGTFA